MRWKDGRRSDNIDDRRGQRSKLGSAGAAGAGPLVLRFLPMLLRSRMGRIALVVGVVAIFGGQMLGVDVLSLFLSGGGATTAATQTSAQPSAADKAMSDSLALVLGDTEDTWHQIFRQLNQPYQEPTLVLFTDGVNSACGSASAAVGPFYCPGDKQLYIDLSFFHDLEVRHGAPGDFAQAYVLAHEVGHHVQTLLGISSQVRAAGNGKSKAQVNALSVRQELQADCFAGLWGHNSDRKTLEPGDLEEALRAATAIGDDRLQQEAGRRVVPDSFTHGTSAQRVKWFSVGFNTGDFKACDTFAARDLG